MNIWAGQTSCSHLGRHRATSTCQEGKEEVIFCSDVAKRVSDPIFLLGDDHDHLGGGSSTR